MSSDNESFDNGIADCFSKLTVNNDSPIAVFCYGSAPGNNTPRDQRNATMGYACVFPYEPKNNTARAIDDGDNATNQRAILQAAIDALKIANDMDPDTEREMEVFSNSGYLNDAMIKYIDKWASNKWRKTNRKPVENQDLLKEILKQKGDRKIAWKHYENDMTDARLEWAREFHKQAEVGAKSAARELATP